MQEISVEGVTRLQLPQEFLKKMKMILGEEFESFQRCYDDPPFRALRVNTLKCSDVTVLHAFPEAICPAPFSLHSYYLTGDCQYGRHPLHHAGAFYIQEPSASAVVAALSPQPGDRVLDLCAAPGGKSTQIAAMLQGRGLLWANEVVKNRAQTLLSNIERMGVRNAVVSSCTPEKLCTALTGYFDKVLVDAPCSGEGMFRKEERAWQDWSPEHVSSCAERQAAILDSAAAAVCEGGILAYSTCTFSPEENEEVVARFLERHSDFSIKDCMLSCGRPAISKDYPELRQARRIFPMDGGEGHFIAVMQRNSKPLCKVAPYSFQPPAGEELRRAEEVYSELFQTPPYGRLMQSGDRLLLLPEDVPSLHNLGVIRAGVLFAEVKKDRLEPAHAVFMAARPQELYSLLDFATDDGRLQAYLRGEEIGVDPGMRGYTGVAVDGVMLGFGKCSAGRLKNRYPKGLRLL
jgi:NOL1/NOP2/sun family putative RNA methylase